jgi:hypothetical protein
MWNFYTEPNGAFSVQGAAAPKPHEEDFINQHMSISLPAGVSYRNFASKADYFRDSAGGNKVNVPISQSGKMAIL